MTEIQPEIGKQAWKKFLSRHWKMIVVFVVGAIIASICAVLVYLWFVGHAQSIDLVPQTLGLWTMGYIVTFILHLIFWEIVLIGIPVIIIAAVTLWLWWKKIPAEEKAEYKRERYFFGPRSRATSGGSGGISFLIFIIFCIKVYIDGNWNVAFATWSLDYLVYSWLWALIWVLIIFGIPAILALTWWVRREMKKVC